MNSLRFFEQQSQRPHCGWFYVITLLMALGFAASAGAAPPPRDWVEFKEETCRIQASESVLHDAPCVVPTGCTPPVRCSPQCLQACACEKDMATGDWNGDTFDDFLVIVRKEPLYLNGGKSNFLFVLEDGRMVDRTDLVEGFAENTIDRDVVVVDINGDLNPDIVTAATFGDPPRTYINLGCCDTACSPSNQCPPPGQSVPCTNPGANWCGLKNETGRIPSFLPEAPFFCGVAAGDLNGDLCPDLYFVDYQNTLEDRLLLNGKENGVCTGVFTDNTTDFLNGVTVCPPGKTCPPDAEEFFYQSTFGTGAQIVDIDGSQCNDILKSDTGAPGIPGTLKVIYNKKDAQGNCGDFWKIEVLAPSDVYMGAAGDFNGDGNKDVYVLKGVQDTFRIKLADGTFAGPKPVSGGAAIYQLGNVVLADLDSDDDHTSDVIRPTVDTSTAGCDDRLVVLQSFINPCQGPGCQPDIYDVTVKDQFVVAPRAFQTQGVYDVALIDVNGDLQPDMWQGTCAGNKLFTQGRDTTDCNENGFVDGCDIVDGMSLDVNANGIPDDCMAPTTAAYPHDRLKNRYISFNPTVDNGPVAFQVTLTGITLGSCDGTTGGESDFCRTGQTPGDCNRCSGGGNSCINAAIDCNPGETCDPTGETCINDAPNLGGSNVGQVWWVGPEYVDPVSGLGNSVHLLVSTPLFRNDWPNPVHVADCEIVPLATYEIRATSDGTTFSAPLEVKTTLYASTSSSSWGDVVGPLKKYCDGDIRTAECTTDTDCTWPATCDQAWTLPDGSVNFDDVNAALALVQSGSMLPPPDLTWVDLHGNATGTLGSQNFDPPNFVANQSDVQRILSGFGGFPYKGYDPADCPDAGSWPSFAAPPPPSGSPVFTLVPSGDLFDPSENVLVEVYVSEATNVFAQEVALEVTGGTSGGLSLVDITVDSNRSDYLFYGITAPLEAKDLTGQRIGSSLNAAGAGVTKTGQTYLATFTYQPVNGATGVFHIDVRGETKSFLLDPDGSAQETIPSGCAVVGYGVDCLTDAHCDDNNECTTDTCSPTNTCQYANVASGTACDDGLWCTRTGSTCDGNGLCTGGAPRCPPGYLCDEGGQQCFGAPPP